MDLSDLTRRIDSVQDASEPSVVRLDEGAALRSRVAVLPSAFNPPTLAHMALLDAARKVDGVSSVAALLTTRNVDKGLYGASMAHRAAMLLELEGQKIAVLVSNQARIADQARLFAESCPGIGVDMIVGFDTLIRVFDDQYYTAMHEELTAFFADHRLIAANRASHGAEEISQFVERPDVVPFADRIVVCEIGDEAAAMSSTEARESVADGRETSELPTEVRNYIERHGLYAAPSA